MAFDKKEYQRRLMRERRAKEKGLVKPVTVFNSGTDAEVSVPILGDDTPLFTYADGELMTASDRKFEEKRPGYFIYESLEFERMCHTCFKKFKTRMNLLKFCSPKCQRDKLDSLDTMGVKID